MTFRPDHELHKRRFGKNMALLAVLVAFVALVFGLTIVRIGGGASMEAFDHAPRISLEPTTTGGSE